MKGEKTINLEGDDIKIRFDFGAIEDFCEDMGIDFSGWQEEVFSNPKNIRMLAYYMAKDHNKDLEAEDLRRMQMSELSKIMDLITESTDGLEKQAGNAKKGKGKK